MKFKSRWVTLKSYVLAPNPLAQGLVAQLQG
jgi:hypothetical protein